MAILTEEKIKEIIDTYQNIKTYSGVAKQCGVSASTVKKYVELNKPKPIIKRKLPDEIIAFNGSIAPANTIKIPPHEERNVWGRLTKQELQALDDLRREI